MTELPSKLHRKAARDTSQESCHLDKSSNLHERGPHRPHESCAGLIRQSSRPDQWLWSVHAVISSEVSGSSSLTFQRSYRPPGKICHR